jgi:NAD(P)-dependent dehydrogenase (short-subunit alcohol dehydrogenase family)
MRSLRSGGPVGLQRGNVYKRIGSLFRLHVILCFSNFTNAINLTSEIYKWKMKDVARQPMGRLGKAAEVAAWAPYLASDGNEFTTGQYHVIDGGWVT